MEFDPCCSVDNALNIEENKRSPAPWHILPGAGLLRYTQHGQQR